MSKIIDLLFALVGDSEKHAMQWMFGYNNHFKDTPVNMIAKGKEEEVYGYLHFYVYGPY